MPIYLRNNIWQIDFVTASGKRVRRSAGTKDKTAAQELHDKLKHELWRVERMGDKPSRTWDEACVRWLKEKGSKKSIKDDMGKMRALTQLRGMLLSDLNRDFLMAVIEELPCSKSTKNRYISLIRAILKKCAGEWEWIDKAPTLTQYREPRHRIRFLYPSQAETLLSNLNPFYRDLASFSLMTGMRQANVLNLEWSQVDLSMCIAWVHSDQTKGDRPIGVALNDTAMEILRRRKKLSREYVFGQGKNKTPLKRISAYSWENALKRSGIENFTWHDLRHTWASWLIQRGVPLMELKEMGGWETLEMVQRYAHLAPQHLQKNAVLISGLHVTNMSQ